MDKENLKINSHYRDSENKIKYFCDIEYKQGTEYVLTIYSDVDIKADMQGECYTCFDGENTRYILNNLQFEEDKGKLFYGKRYYFQSLMVDTRKHFITEKNLNNCDVKFTSLSFTFPYINSFFITLIH